MTNETKDLVVVLLILGGAALLLNPKCRGGCTTLAEHLLTHGLKAVL